MYLLMKEVEECKRYVRDKSDMPEQQKRDFVFRMNCYKHILEKIFNNSVYEMIYDIRKRQGKETREVW
jgi:hypothetical protein